VFTYEIVRPHAVESLPQGHVRSIIQQARNTALALVQQRAPNPTPDQDGFIRQNGRMYMDKVPYTKWLEGSVRPVFPRGRLATLKVLPIKPEVIPSPLFTIDDLQEVCWMAAMDNEWHEPRCVAVKPRHLATSAQIWYPPALLRPLSLEEVTLVHLRDTQEKRQQIASSNDTFAG
jgi:hypothetical protein